MGESVGEKGALSLCSGLFWAGKISFWKQLRPFRIFLYNNLVVLKNINAKSQRREGDGRGYGTTLLYVTKCHIKEKSIK